MEEIKASGLPFTARGKMTSILVFCGRANFLIKVHDSAADSLCYLWRRRGPSPLRVRGKKKKLPWRENTGHFDVTRYVLEDGKASDLPHAGYYGYGLRECINILSNMCCPALITQSPKGIYETVDFFFYSLVPCVLWLLGGHTRCWFQKELISYPSAGETQQMSFLAYRHIRYNKR